MTIAFQNFRESLDEPSTLTCDVSKDDKQMTITVVNESGNKRNFSECKIRGIHCIFSDENDLEIILAKGLKLNKSLSSQDVINKWGEPTSDMSSGDVTELRYKKESYVYYLFSFDSNARLYDVRIDNWNIDAAKEHMEEEIEENTEEISEESLTQNSLKSYEEPMELTSEFTDYVFRLENKLYSLPAPVSEFTDDGWEITTKPDSVVAGNELALGTQVKKGDIELIFSIENFSDVAVEAEKTMVTGVFVNKEVANNLDFELSGGITFGMNISDFESNVDVSKFTIEEPVSGMVKYSYIEITNATFLTFKDGEFRGVDISKNVCDE